MCRRTVAIFILGVSLLGSMAVLAQTANFIPSPHIYKLRVAGCRYPPVERTLTGFRIKGQIGIVTALHGVAGCQTINAQPAAGGPGPFNKLMIGKVDIDRDMALLWSKELAAAPADGLAAVVHPQPSDYQGVEVIGYPYGLIQQKPTIDVKIVETTTLGYLVPPDLVNALNERSSPAIDIQVFSVQAHLVPGHSGAPLINAAGRVIGVGNGGLDLGRVEMGWAIPWSTIQWKTVSAQVAQDVSWTDVRRLLNLVASSPTLFAFATPDETNDFSAAATITPTLTVTATPMPKPTVAPSKAKVSIKVYGAGAVRTINLVAPSTVEQK
ncbi:MAG: serine protease [Caldilineaceae bacterium]